MTDDIKRTCPRCGLECSNPMAHRCPHGKLCAYAPPDCDECRELARIEQAKAEGAKE